MNREGQARRRRESVTPRPRADLLLHHQQHGSGEGHPQAQGQPDASEAPSQVPSLHGQDEPKGDGLSGDLDAGGAECDSRDRRRSGPLPSPSLGSSHQSQDHERGPGRCQ